MSAGSGRLLCGMKHLMVAALALYTLSVSQAQSIAGEADAGRPIPGAPPGIVDVAEGQGGVAVDVPAVADVTMPSNALFSGSLSCGGMAPLTVGALAAGMVLMYAPARRRHWPL